VTGEPRQRDGFMEHELYRMATELVTNARRHARAARIVIELEWRDDAVVLLVKDDGVGMSDDRAGHAARGHFGLMGIHERARWLGGDVAIMSGAGLGTEVRVTVPLQPRSAA
jgi:two-component system, NarL family, sensor histidine kinase UhpB